MNIKGNTALLVVDFQGGDLSGPKAAYAHGQLHRAQALVAASRAAGVPVIWVQEVHKPHLADIGRELDGSEGPHCIEGNPATEIATGLGPVGAEHHIRKRRYSSFFATELDIVLKQYQVETLVMIGGFTDICILYTSVDAHQRDLTLNVVGDVVAGSSRQAHDDALKMIQHLQPSALVTSQDVLNWLAVAV
ncbi:cysteine hydrolase [Kineosporia rhizophila]|uniref:cysteine hydrolase family protein n=1 Tax=Kineosporia TaxID=49184 RepID=UPI001E62A7B9|nr:MULTISPECIES: isochorismatase family cysteine hydrolase [Kineosporia]MCE0536414.1 cysteine hydrolase [Kineosporia rhizophila]GLY15494.1 hypothetical protein Kisp01_25090 [Kineosporia sp. NBRC 101677]